MAAVRNLKRASVICATISFFCLLGSVWIDYREELRIKEKGDPGLGGLPEMYLMFLLIGLFFLFLLIAAILFLIAFFRRA